MKRTPSLFLLVALTSLFVATSGYADLIAHWPLDENGDDVVGGFDGTVADRVEFVSDGANANTGGAADFDFGDGGIQAEFAEELNPEDDFTVTAWANPIDTANWNSVVTSREDNGSTVNGFIIYNSPENQWDFWTGGAGATGQWVRNIGSEAELDEWTHLAITYNRDEDVKILYVNGEADAVFEGPPSASQVSSYNANTLRPFNIGAGEDTGTNFYFVGRIDDVSLWDETLSQEAIASIAELGVAGYVGGAEAALRAGDADQDFDFDQLDLVKVQVGGKYLTGQAATWGEGDWNGAPGGTQGNPPAGDGLFDQIDIIAALGAGTYLQGPYAAVQSGGVANDGQTSVGYDAGTGEVFVDAPAGVELTSINIDSASGIFTGDAAQNLGGSFDNDADNNIFKATFGGSFGSLTFGNVAPAGLAQDMLMNDLTVVGSLAGGGDLGNVDLIYVPEPNALLLLLLGVLGTLRIRRR